MARSILKISLCTLLSGCAWVPGCMNTGGRLELKGKVVDEQTGNLLPGRKVIVQSLIPSGKKEIARFSGQFSTDNTGHFTYTLQKSKDTYFYNFAFAGDSTYAFSNRRLGLYDLKTNSKFLTFTLPKLANLAITIEKTSKSPVDDILYVSWRSDNKEGKVLYPWKIENYGAPPDIAFRWKGARVRSVIRTKVYAEKKTVVTFGLVRNGKKSEFTRTLFCNREGENNVNFRY